MMMLPSCFISFVWHARTHAHTTVIVRQAIFVPACYAIFTLIEGRCTVFCLHQARAAPMTDSRWRRLCLQIKTSDDIESPLWQHPIQSRYCSVIEQFRSDDILGQFGRFVEEFGAFRLFSQSFPTIFYHNLLIEQNAWQNGRTDPIIEMRGRIKTGDKPNHIHSKTNTL